MKIPYKGGGIALFQKNSETGEYSMLLGKRKHNPGKGKWSIPGGGYEERDKDLSETARREFREETGLSLDDIVVEGSNKPVICNIVIPFIFRWRTLIFILKDDWKYDNRRFHEFSEVKQIPLSELNNYELAFGIKQEVRKFKRKYL